MKVDEIKDEDIQKLKKYINEAEAIIIGGGAGLSTAAGYYYSGERFHKYFFDFINMYKFKDMYTTAFYHFSTPEEHWAFWSRLIYVNRYTKIPLSSYDDLFSLIKNKNYFVLTTNGDHCFQKAGFSKDRLFYTQGDYGLFQCKKPCQQKTYDNKELVIKMILDQGFKIGGDNDLIIEQKNNIKMKVKTESIPKCPECGGIMTYNLRADDSFVEDEGWHKASSKYQKFLEENKNKKVLFFELGVGFNTPGIIKYPFMKYTFSWPNAKYCCINMGEAFAPKEIKNKSLIFNTDINNILKKIS